MSIYIVAFKHEYPPQTALSLQTLLAALPYPFAVIDVATHRVLHANPAALQGRPLAGATCYALHHGANEPCNHPDHVCPLREVVRTRRALVVEHTHLDEQGQPRLLQIHAYPILDPTGAVVALIEASVDITAQRRAEHERERLIADLRRALDQVKTLTGLLPICASCKKIRDGAGQWQPLEAYLTGHTDAELTHGLCPDCAEALYPAHVRQPRREP